MFKRLFSFKKTYDNLGVGTGDLGLLQFQTLPEINVYLGNTGRRQWNIRRSLAPISAPGYMMLNQGLVPVPLTGSTGGLGVPGQIVGQTLAKGNNQ